MRKTSEIRDKLEELIFSGRDYLFLIGSGISIQPPSNLVSGNIFMKEILRRISPNEKTKELLLELSNSIRKEKISYGDFIRFEELMQELNSIYGGNLDVLDCFSDCIFPNKNHYAIAGLIAQGACVFTANFDSLIEIAFLNLYKKDLSAFISDHEFQDYLSNPGKYSFPLFKLHGSLKRRENNIWIDSKESIKATLESVAKGGDNFIFEPSILTLFSTMLKKYDLIIMGYSGYDDFDICALLNMTKSDKKLIWINHCRDENRYSWDDINEMKDQYRDICGNYLRNEHNFIYSVGYNKLRAKSNIYLFDYDTADVIDIFINKHNIQIEHEKLNRKNEFNVNNYLDNWDAKIAPDISTKHLICANILLKKNRYECAQENYLEIINMPENEMSAERIGRKIEAINNLGLLYEEKGDMSLALKCLYDALEFYKELDLRNDVAHCIGSIGNIKRALGRNDEAKKSYKEALKICKDIGDWEGEAMYMGNIGNICCLENEYNEAICYHNSAIEIFLKMGKINELAKEMNSLGSVYYEKRKMKKALLWYQGALMNYIKTGDIHGKAGVLCNVGNVYYYLRAKKHALQCFLEAEKIFNEIDLKPGKASVSILLGNLYSEMGEYCISIEYYEKARQLHNETSNKRGEANALYNMGLTYINMKDYKNASDKLNEAIKMFRECNIIEWEEAAIKAIKKISKHNERR